MKLQKAVALRVLQLLDEHKITYYELSKRMLTDASTVKHILHEDNKTIKLETIHKIASALNLSIQDFFSNNLFKEVDEPFDK